MLRALIACTALVLAAAGDPPAQVGVPKPNPQQKTAKPPMLTSASIDSSDPDGSGFDPQAEAQLLKLANRDRAVAGLPPLLPIKGLLEPLETMRSPWPTPNNFRTSSRASLL